MSDHDADESYDQYDGSLDVRHVTADSVSSAWIKHHNSCLVELDNPHQIAHFLCTTDWYPRRDVLELFCRMTCVEQVDSRDDLFSAI